MGDFDGIIFPMNVKTATNLEALLDDPTYVGELKADGYRYISKRGQIMSRIGTDRTANVPHIHNVLKEVNAITDGEMFYPGKTSNYVTEVMGCLPAKSIARQNDGRGLIQYYIFDLLEYQGRSLINYPWTERRFLLDECLKKDIESVDISYSVPSFDKRALLAHAKANDLEGLVLKKIDSLYYLDKRPEHTWYRVKKNLTYDVVIMGFNPGKGKFLGLIGSIEYGLYKDGVLTPCGKCSGVLDSVRILMSASPELYIGLVMEISSMERTVKGKFKQPQYKRIRNDKLPTACLWDDEKLEEDTGEVEED